ncbi:YeeE/YedE family protein [Celeribacter arenosi]|uniref:YeeE/YedE family protein n=1 Tax=Celeribacter arenosi TaxID=792649 RepID=A0ABP7KAM1_9RHOB
MYESLGLDLEPRQAAILLGLILGLAFGGLAEVTRFCFRRAVAGPKGERGSAAAVWLTALAAAVVGVQIAVSRGLISFDDHRFLSADLPWLAIALGGLMFGAGMVLTRGCVSRLTVLAGSGNLRAVLVLVTFAIVAHATLKGVLAPIRTTLGSVTVPLGSAALPGPAVIWVALVVAVAAFAVWRYTTSKRDIALGLLIGLVAVAGWVGTGFVLYDDFDPIAFESLSFTLPSAETLFWGVASTAVPAGFGTGLIGGVLVGALALSLISGRFAWQSFESPAQTGRYLSGAVLMGVGGVLAGGCTVGAGLSGVPTLSVAALLAIFSIGVGGIVTARFIGDGSSSTAAATATPQGLPAE